METLSKFTYPKELNRYATSCFYEIFSIISRIKRSFSGRVLAFLHALCSDTVILSTTALSATILYRYQDKMLNNQDIFNQGN